MGRRLAADFRRLFKSFRIQLDMRPIASVRVHSLEKTSAAGLNGLKPFYGGVKFNFLQQSDTKLLSLIGLESCSGKKIIWSEMEISRVTEQGRLLRLMLDVGSIVLCFLQLEREEHIWLSG